MKLAIFFEGDCEGILLKQLLWNYCSNVSVTEDVLEFTSTPSPIVLLYNCGGYQSVFPAINEYAYLTNNGITILAIRDTEKAPCFTSVKNEGVQANGALKGQAVKWAVFAKPNLEALYRADLNLFSQCVKAMYQQTHGNNSFPQNFQNDINSINFSFGKQSLEGLFLKYNITFNKKKLATKFFSQFDYSNTQDTYFLRLKGSLVGLACNNL